MRIKRLDLIAFGPFTDQTLTFDSKGPGLTVIFGPNEAGKSSSLRGLKSLLYGIPERTSDNFLHPNDQLLLGGSLVTANGEEITFRRRKRRKRSLFDQKDNPLDPEALAPFVRGITLDEFETLYGIDHEALVRGGMDILEQKGELGQALFSAGAGILSLKEVLGSLDEEADRLFRPRASTRKINQALALHRSLQKDIRSATLSGRDWIQLDRALQTTRDALAVVEGKRREAAAELRRLERLKQTLPQLALRRRYLSLLKDLGHVPPLPDDFAKRRRKAADDLQTARQNRHMAESRLTSLREKLEKVSFHQTLVDENERIEALYQRLGSHQKAMKDRPKLEGMRISCRTEAGALFRQLPTALPLEQAEKLRPFLAKKKSVQLLASQHEALKQACNHYRLECINLDESAILTDRALKEIPPQPDTIHLAQAVRLARKVGDLDDQLLEKETLSERRKGQLQKELSQLGLWHGNLEAIHQVSLLLKETILRFVEDFRNCEESVRTAEKEHANLLETLNRITAQIREIEFAGEVPTEKELLEVRKERDAQWRMLKRYWLKGEDITPESRLYTEKDDLAKVYEDHCQLADQLSDRLRREADRVHKFAALKADQLTGREALETNRKNLEGLGIRSQALSKKWQQLWRQGGITPLPPKEMLNWAEKFETIRLGANDLNSLEEVIASQKTQRDNLKKKLLEELSTIGNEKDFQGNTLEPLLLFCETLVEDLNRKRTDRQTLMEKKQRLVSDLKAARQRERSALEELSNWESKWRETSALFPMARETRGVVHRPLQPEEINDILDNLENCFSKLKEADGLKKRIEGIDRDAKSFVMAVQEMILKVAPDLKDLNPEQAVYEMQRRLRKNLEQMTLFGKYTREVEEAEVDLAKALEAIQSAKAKTSRLRGIAGCKETDDLEEVERLAREHEDLKTKLNETETALIKSSEGLGISALEQQASAFDPDELPGRIDALNREMEQQLDPDIRRLSIVLGEKRKELQQMDGRSKAADAALSSQQLVAVIRRMSERFVRLKAASALLRQEIERFRNENQDPIINMASAYFRRLTLGSFEGLRTDEDDRGRPVLAGVKDQNRMIRVEGMSSGTRDQLYLALRLASLERRGESGETMPFVVDDILVNFDDARAKAALLAMAHLAINSQIILFTHHERISREAEKMAEETNIVVHSI